MNFFLRVHEIIPQPVTKLISPATTSREQNKFLLFLRVVFFCAVSPREAISGSELNAQKSGKLANFLPHFGSQNSKSSTRGKGRIRGSRARHFRHLEGRKSEKFSSFFSDQSPFDEGGFVHKMRLLYKFWAFPPGKKPNRDFLRPP